MDTLGTSSESLVPVEVLPVIWVMSEFFCVSPCPDVRPMFLGGGD